MQTTGPASPAARAAPPSFGLLAPARLIVAVAGWLGIHHIPVSGANPGLESSMAAPAYRPNGTGGVPRPRVDLEFDASYRALVARSRLQVGGARTAGPTGPSAMLPTWLPNWWTIPDGIEPYANGSAPNETRSRPRGAP